MPVFLCRKQSGVKNDHQDQPGQHEINDQVWFTILLNFLQLPERLLRISAAVPGIVVAAPL